MLFENAVQNAVPFLVWAICLYIYIYSYCIGPLSILQENWPELTDLSPNTGKSTSDYMRRLKENLETVAGKVNDYAANAQEQICVCILL